MRRIVRKVNEKKIHLTDILIFLETSSCLSRIQLRQGRTEPKRLAKLAFVSSVSLRYSGFLVAFDLELVLCFHMGIRLLLVSFGEGKRKMGNLVSTTVHHLGLFFSFLSPYTCRTKK